MMNKANIEGKVIYLTGSTGYLGNEILRKIFSGENYNFENKNFAGNNDNDNNNNNNNNNNSKVKNLPCSTVYLPIREKKGKSGQDRFNMMLAMFDTTKKQKENAQWIDPSSPIPNDTQIVILNAYDISFNRDIADILKSSVAPIVNLLEQCRDLPNLEKIIFISTAYVQPPLPYRQTDNVIPFSGSNDPMTLYNDILDGKTTWQDLKDDKQNNPHTTSNTYIFSKTLMENILCTYFSCLPAVCVRPSIIGAASDGTRGSRFSPGCGAALFSFVKFPGCCGLREGRQDYVMVDKVAEQVLQPIISTTSTASTSACSSSSRYCNNDHKIVWATSGQPINSFDLIKQLNPKKPLLNFNKQLQKKAQRAEIIACRVFAGKKFASHLKKGYANFNYFNYHTFDFPQTSGQDVSAYVAATKIWCASFLQEQKQQTRFAS